MGETDKLRSGIQFLRETGERLDANGCTNEYMAEALLAGIQLLDKGEDLASCYELEDDCDAARWKQMGE